MQYGKANIPGYFDLAAKFTLCDNYFSEVAGPSTPNHLMLICADAPIINNPHNHYRPNAASRYQLPSLPAALEKAGLSWGNYGLRLRLHRRPRHGIVKLFENACGSVDVSGLRGGT